MPATTARTTTTESNAAQYFRKEVARYMAFAFCRADALIETDVQGAVVFATGATRHLFGRSSKELTGQNFQDLADSGDRSLVEALLERAASGARFVDTTVGFVAGDRGRRPMVISGYGVPDLEHHCFVTVREPAEDELVHSSKSVRDDTGMLTPAAFSDTVERYIGPTADIAADMTVFGLAGIPELKQRLPEEEWHGLQTRIGSFLGALSISGDAATRFGEDRFGMLHTPGVDVTGIRSHLQRFSKDVDPSGVGCEVTSETTAFSDIDLSGHDAARAVLFTLKSLAGGDGPGAGWGGPASIAQKLHDTARNLQFVRETIRQERFDIAYQPIVSLQNRMGHHFEALVRLTESGAQPGVKMNPYEFVCFAEDVDLVGEFDFAMCRKLCRRVTSVLERGPALPVAVNVSGRTIVGEGFLPRIKALLEEFPSMHGQLIFEITETARIHDLGHANRIIRELRADGFHICLDDFGAGQSAFEYLRDLEVDYVKIDGQYVLDATKNAKGEAFLKAMAWLCRELGVATIAERIETEDQVAFLKECGIAYGQGYHFGKPTLSPEFSGRPPAKANARRKGASTEWR